MEFDIDPFNTFKDDIYSLLIFDIFDLNDYNYVLYFLFTGNNFFSLFFCPSFLPRKKEDDIKWKT